ncbi:hypothetical protein B0H19DRAFT_1120728 [Mycena capillaripes]|nr:hypothetical protein B0H19DRAFT_1120728 [Mycena capillaripes]
MAIFRVACTVCRFSSLLAVELSFDDCVFGSLILVPYLCYYRRPESEKFLAADRLEANRMLVPLRQVCQDEISSICKDIEGQASGEEKKKL